MNEMRERTLTEEEQQQLEIYQEAGLTTLGFHCDAEPEALVYAPADFP